MPKPDLRSLSAWDIPSPTASTGDTPGKDYLAFSANVWNAGPAPLVVDGFRSPGEDLMDAYQYFYDADGKQVGYAPTGTTEWEPCNGHEHWHFTDFASYRLLSADQTKEVRSGKEAFCLANTGAIDYTVKNANWHPDNTDLPNGTYYIQVIANPRSGSRRRTPTATSPCARSSWAVSRTPAP